MSKINNKKRERSSKVEILEFKEKKLNGGLERYLRILLALFIFMGAIAMIAPLYGMISTSLKSTAEIYSVKMIWGPSSLNFNNYLDATSLIPLFQFMGNTVVIAGGKILGEVFVSAAVAFGFARFKFRGKNILFIILLASMAIPYEVTMIPQFIAGSKLGYVDTYVPLILPAYFGSASFIFFLRMYFQTIPKDLDEAAIMDGANYFQIFGRIYIPIAKPALIVIALGAFIGTGNDLLGQMIYIHSYDKFTIQLGLSLLNGSVTGSQMGGPLMAASFLALLPSVLLMLGAQKHFTNGVKMSGIKG